MVLDVAVEGLRVLRGRPAGESPLQVAVQAFVRVLLRGIERQEEELYNLFVLFAPFPFDLAMLHREVVQDKEQLSRPCTLSAA